MDELTLSRLYELIPTVDDLILTVDDLATLLKLRPKTIYNHISAGRLTREDGVCHLNEWPAVRAKSHEGSESPVRRSATGSSQASMACAIASTVMSSHCRSFQGFRST
jgi:hypothetical protein